MRILTAVPVLNEDTNSTMITTHLGVGNLIQHGREGEHEAAPREGARQRGDAADELV